MFLFVANHKLEGVFNAVAPNPVSNAKLIKEIATVLDKPLFLPNIPKFVLKLFLGKMAYLLLDSQRVSSKKIEDEGFVFHYQNICRCLENLYQKQGHQDNSISINNQEYIQ